jgi:hypothetical protein
MIDEGAATLSRVKLQSLAVVAMTCAVVLSAFVSAASSELAVKWGPGYVAPDGSYLPAKHPDQTGKSGKACKIDYVSSLNAIPSLPDQIKGGSGICADTTPTQLRFRVPSTAMRHPKT